MSQTATFAYEKGLKALQLYRRIMKLHIRNMPQDLRMFGDLYVKQEFRLHLDKATDDQMDKFLKGWTLYADQIKQVNPQKPKEIKKQLANQDFDSLFKDKFNEEQYQTLGEFKELIYESEKKKKERAMDNNQVMDEFEFMGGETNTQNQFQSNGSIPLDGNNFMGAQPNLNADFGNGGFDPHSMLNQSNGSGIKMNSMNDFVPYGGEGSGSFSNRESKNAGASNNWGFQPAQTSFSPNAQFEDDLDDEERERILQAETAEEERKRQLYDKMNEEDNLKKQRKIQGKTELDKWSQQRRKEIENQRKINEEQQKQQRDLLEKERNSANPWERVVNNCEMNSSHYVGGADVGRMRQAMLARKKDITQAGGMNKAKNML